MSKQLCLHSQCRGEGGAAPFILYDVILRRRPQAALPPKDLVTRKLFFARRGAGEVVCTAPKKLNVYENEKSLCSFKITQ